MKVLLSHSIAEADGPLASRLRAVAASYGVTLLLPERRPVTSRALALPKNTAAAIMEADAVLALVTEGSRDQKAVSAELSRALEEKKPIVLLTEGSVSLPKVQGEIHAVRFDRQQPARHEAALAKALDRIRKRKVHREAQTAAVWDALTVGAIAGIAIGLLSLGAAALRVGSPDQEVQVE